MLSAAQMHNKAEDAGTFLEKREARKEKEHSVAPKNTPRGDFPRRLV